MSASQSSGYQLTSYMAWEEIQDRLPACRKAVFDAIFYSGPEGITDEEISRALGWSINRVTPRRNELVKMGYVTEKFTRSCSVTGHSAIAWTVVSSPFAPVKAAKLEVTKP